MEYFDIVGQVQTGTTGFVGNFLQGVVAFCLFVIIMLAGWYVAGLIGMVLRRFLEEMKVEKFLKEHEVHDAFIGFTFTNISVGLLKLYVLVAFLAIAAGIIQVPVVAYLAAQVIGYLPMLFQGIVILMAGLLAGDYITDRMKMSKKVPFINALAIIVEVFIAYNALVIALPMILPAADPSLLVWSFLIVLGAVGIALGFGTAIALGLGLKDTVSDIAKKHKGKFDSLL